MGIFQMCENKIVVLRLILLIVTWMKLTIADILVCSGSTSSNCVGKQCTVSCSDGNKIDLFCEEGGVSFSYNTNFGTKKLSIDVQCGKKIEFAPCFPFCSGGNNLVQHNTPQSLFSNSAGTPPMFLSSGGSGVGSSFASNSNTNRVQTLTSSSSRSTPLPPSSETPFFDSNSGFGAPWFFVPAQPPYFFNTLPFTVPSQPPVFNTNNQLVRPCFPFCNDP